MGGTWRRFLPDRRVQLAPGRALDTSVCIQAQLARGLVLLSGEAWGSRVWSLAWAGLVLKHLCRPRAMEFTTSCGVGGGAGGRVSAL